MPVSSPLQEIKEAPTTKHSSNSKTELIKKAGQRQATPYKKDVELLTLLNQQYLKEGESAMNDIELLMYLIKFSHIRLVDADYIYSLASKFT